MDGVSNTNATGTIGGPTGISSDSAPSLTPEMLLAYCSSRLSTVDATMDTFFAEQKRIGNEAKEISAVLEVAGRCEGGEIDLAGITKLNGGLSGYDCAMGQKWADMANDLRDVWLSSTSPEAKKIAAEEFKLRTGRNIEEFADEGHKVTAPDIEQSLSKGLIHTVSRMDADTRLQGYKEKLTGLTKDGELNMIQLQSAVSQRQLAVQLTTQLMQTIHETLKSVVGNVRS